MMTPDLPQLPSLSGIELSALKEAERRQIYADLETGAKPREQVISEHDIFAVVDPAHLTVRLDLAKRLV
jgi:hypothetical protein